MGGVAARLVTPHGASRAAGLFVRLAVAAEPSTQGVASDQRFHRLRAAELTSLSLPLTRFAHFWLVALCRRTSPPAA
jgi:hypothetical protein